MQGSAFVVFQKKKKRTFMKIILLFYPQHAYHIIKLNYSLLRYFSIYEST